jgi:hypothetical protein
LSIPTDLPNLAPPSLHTAYVKYKVLAKSTSKIASLWSNDEWADHLVDFGVDYWVSVFADLVNIFITKSQFYASWKPLFMRAQEYPKMLAWLNDDSDCDSDSELWGEAMNKNDYSFVNLTTWLNEKDGKKPAATSSRAGKKVAMKEKRKKEKRVASESSSESSEEKQEKEKEKAKAKAKKGKKKASE